MRAALWCAAVLVVVAGGCRSVVCPQGVEACLDIPPGPNAPMVTITPETPDTTVSTLTATASGSLDPGRRNVRYRFEWFRGETLERTAQSDSEDSVSGLLVKNETWRVEVTPITSDDREGEPVTATVQIGNALPSGHTIAMSTYHPATSDVVRAALVGFVDPDPVDTDRSIYRWRIGDRAVIEGQTAELDLGALNPPVNTDTEQLVLEVVPSDGDGANENAAITLGPFSFLSNATQWRALRPSTRIGDATTGSLVAFDGLHRRWIVYSGIAGIWEYTDVFGFVQLSEATDTSFRLGFTPLTTSTVDGGRLIALTNDGLSSQAVLEVLELEDRGRESHARVSLGIVARAHSHLHYDHDATLLLIYGGGVVSAQADRVFALDLSDLSEPNWITPGGIATGFPIVAGALAQSPINPTDLFVFGGCDTGVCDADNASPVLKLEYSVEPFDISVTVVGDALLQSPFRPVAAPDPTSGTIIGGFGAEGTSFGGPLEQVWEFDPETAELVYRSTDLFSDFSAETGAWGGVAGFDGGRVVIFPGMTVDSFDTNFQVVEARREGVRHVWKALLQRKDVPLETGPGLWVSGALEIAAAGIDQMFRYDPTRNEWEPGAPYPTPGPSGLSRVWGGETVTGDAIWRVGGVSMAPYQYDGAQWQAVANDVGPRRFVDHAVFDPGCGETLPIGFVGGAVHGEPAADAETWLLRCPGDTNCAWQENLGNKPGIRQAAAAVYDGARYTLLFGGLSSDDKVWRLDTCGDPSGGWQEVSVMPDPTYGFPPNGDSVAVRIPEASPHAFLVMAGDTTWVLGQTAPASYAWVRVRAEPSAVWGALGSGPRHLFWDASRNRALLTDSGGEVWELRNAALLTAD